MEHRCSDRHCADIQILIHKYQLPVAIGKIKNGTRHGMYIESDMVGVRPLQQVGIEVLAYKNSQKLHRYKFDAIVIHSNDHGFGVELESLPREEADSLMELLSSNFQTPTETDLFKYVASA